MSLMWRILFVSRWIIFLGGGSAVGPWTKGSAQDRIKKAVQRHAGANLPYLKRAWSDPDVLAALLDAEARENTNGFFYVLDAVLAFGDIAVSRRFVRRSDRAKMRIIGFSESDYPI